jgi:hypothetical protein
VYQENQKHSCLKVGDVVVVTRTARDNEQGWLNFRMSSMDGSVDKQAELIKELEKKAEKIEDSQKEIEKTRK